MSCGDNSTDDGLTAQQLPKIVLNADNRPVVVEEIDGVVTALHPLRLVPTALWNLGILLPLPYWAEEHDPPTQFLALLVDLVSRQKDALAALHELRISVKAAHILAKQGVGPAVVVERLETALARINAVAKALDP